MNQLIMTSISWPEAQPGVMRWASRWPTISVFSLGRRRIFSFECAAQGTTVYWGVSCEPAGCSYI